MAELIWDGKYVDGKRQNPVRVALPFQTIETVNESAVDRQRTLNLFAAGRQTEWRNRLIWGDKKYVLPSLLPEFAGKVNLIYIDPPFDTGADFSYTATIPAHREGEGEEDTSFLKEPSILEQKAYRDTWGRGLDSYLEWFYEAVVMLKELLSENGSLYVHLDWHVGHYAKTVLDEVFGQEACQNEIVWKRTSARSDSHTFNHIHDVIYLYATGAFTFNDVYMKHDPDYVGSKAAKERAAADILGWEFAFEMNETARQVAAESRVDVAFKRIPREVLEKKAVEQGDVKFFELGALSVESKQKGREVTLKLTDFVIPTDDVPEEARKAIKHWSQMIDY